MLVYQAMLPHHLLSSPSHLCVPVMLGDTPALPDSTSQGLEWTSLEIEQQVFLFNVTQLYSNVALVMAPT